MATPEQPARSEGEHGDFAADGCPLGAPHADFGDARGLNPPPSFVHVQKLLQSRSFADHNQSPKTEFWLKELRPR